MPFPSALNAARFTKVMWVDEEVSEHLVAVKKHWKTRLRRGFAFNHLIVKIATRLLPHPTGVCFPLTFHLQAVNFSVNICFFVSSSICKSINTPAVATIPLPKTHLLFRAEGPPPSPADRFSRSSSGRFLPRVLTRPATWHAVSLSPGHTSLGVTSQGWQWPGFRNRWAIIFPEVLVLSETPSTGNWESPLLQHRAKGFLPWNTGTRAHTP